jgi:transglutaminase-like putative cysteine protease
VSAPSFESVEIIDDGTADWARAREASFVIHQRIRYDYPGTVHDLYQHLMVIPPDHHGAQRTVRSEVVTNVAGAHRRQRLDSFGNVITEFRVPAVPGSVEFEAWALITRGTSSGAERVAIDRRYFSFTRLTRPDQQLRDVAGELGRGGCRGLALAERICHWVREAITYEYGITGVRTTAAEALAGGRGVCQDYSHVMLTLCRLVGLPARYVSGHLLGEGGSHAWVEVLLADERRRTGQAVAFDPTHGCQTGPRHLTVAVGRDYSDVAPLWGTYDSPLVGTLTVAKRAGLAAIEYAA